MDAVSSEAPRSHVHLLIAIGVLPPEPFTGLYFAIPPDPGRTKGAVGIRARWCGVRAAD
jgi:hypothetical protein